jgi:PAS domain S-box-containing protein
VKRRRTMRRNQRNRGTAARQSPKRNNAPTAARPAEQRQAKAALEARERELSLIIETIPAFVWSASTDGRLIYVNQRLFDYIGAPMEVLRGEGWVNFVHPDDRREAIDRWLHSVATGAPLENQYRLRRADGVYRWFHVPGQLGRTADGRPTLWYGLLIDIDDRKSVEEALRLTQTKLSRATQIATVGETRTPPTYPRSVVALPKLATSRGRTLRLNTDGRTINTIVCQCWRPIWFVAMWQ